MPDILIRGMEMPDSCEFCRFHGYGGYEFERVVCSLTGRSKEKPIFSRFDDCPFIGIPPHGDLIDLSAKVDCQYYDEMYEEWSIRTVTVEDVLRGCLEKMPPVIVPASEEDG